MSTTEQSAVDLPDIEPLPVAIQFASRGLYLSLERVVPQRVVNPSTGQNHWTAGISYDFDEGRLLLYPGQDKIADRFNPQTGQMEEQDAIEWARGHQLYNTERGFWEVAPVAPDPAPLMATIMQLAVRAGNPETREDSVTALVLLHEQEAESWKREQILTACKTALAAVEAGDAVASLSTPGSGEPWLGSGGASREMPPPPPHPIRKNADGSYGDMTAQAPSSSFKPSAESIGSGFNPDGA